jgi:hypothetical protein
MMEDFNLSRPLAPRRGLCITLLFVLVFPVFAVDYGLFLNQSAQLEGHGGKISDFSGYTLNGAPWLSIDAGETGTFYLSLGLNLEWIGAGFTAVPEINRFEAAFQPLPGIRLAAGRLPYQDSLGFIASGLFDGFSFSMSMKNGRFFGGGYYTGLLYKKTANIGMTVPEREQYNLPVDYDGSFFDNYFAPRRALLSLGGEFAGIFAGILSLEALAQLDCSGDESFLHTEYFMARMAMPLGSLFQTELGGTVSLVEQGPDAVVNMAFAASGALYWLPPTPVTDEARLTLRWSSGTSGDPDDLVRSFLPVTTLSQGQVLRARLSGLMPIGLAYTMRPFEAFTFEAQGAYILRTDLLTFEDPVNELDLDSSSYALGGEIYFSATWTPFSDISWSLAGGAFFPQLGGAYARDAATQWRASLGCVISF